jgi:hypothetical protein
MTIDEKEIDQDSGSSSISRLTQKLKNCMCRGSFKRKRSKSPEIQKSTSKYELAPKNE